MANDATQTQRKPIDKDAIRERYRVERDKRLRSDGNDQYTRIAGLFDEYLEDPYTPVTPRAPKTDHVTFAFVGGGFAGSDVKIGGRIGQWRGRRRLGCRCRSGGQQGDLLGRAGPVGLESDGGCAQQQRCSQDRHRGKDHRTPASHGPLLSSS